MTIVGDANFSDYKLMASIDAENGHPNPYETNIRSISRSISLYIITPFLLLP